MSQKNKKKFPLFWMFYLVYTLLLAGAIVFGLNMLWKFLDVYEATRPVHEMETAISVLEPENRETLSRYLTNTVDNPYEDTSAILDQFYKMTEGKELTFGKLSGAYTEAHPVYAVLAGDTHVATLSFTAKTESMDYNLYGWDLEQVTLNVTPKHSFALTVPSSMKVFVNQIPISEDAVTGTTETNAPVSYVDYLCSGLYENPEIEVFDRYGSPVELTYDEASGGYYYRLAYVTAPDTMKVTFGARQLGEDQLLEGGIAIEELEFLPSVATHFKEYSEIIEGLTIPSINRYYVDFAYTPESVSCENQFGQEESMEYDETTNSYVQEVVSDASLHDECVAFAYEFLEKYALFCAGDLDKTELLPYFPKNSEFYKLVTKLNTAWYNSHTNLTFQNHAVQEVFAYSDNLAYVYVTFEQRMRVTSLGQYKVYPINLPVWIVKDNGKWYIASITFDNFGSE